MGFADISNLPFPWDLLEESKERASAYPGGLVDLSIGTPVDATPKVIQDALIAAANNPGYPATYGTLELREAVVNWFSRCRRVPNVDSTGVLPTVGSKELVAFLPSLLGLSGEDVVVYPAVAYPTYEIGAQLAGCASLATDNVRDWENNPQVKLIWVNTPGNPSGKVLTKAQLREIVAAARRIGAVVISDECYALLPWSDELVAGGVASLLDPEVCAGDSTGLLVTYSLSKQSNLAGYRAAFVAGDSDLIARLLLIRKQAGLIVPGMVQKAMVAALSDDDHVREQYQKYAQRRDILSKAVVKCGLRIDNSEAGLYLWVCDPSVVSGKEPASSWDLVSRFADLGILVAPGAFYGKAGEQHVRLALTASDERIIAAAERLAGKRSFASGNPTET